MMNLAWLHLWSLTVAASSCKKITGKAKGAELEKILNENKDAAFYSGKVLSFKFFIGAEFPKYFGKIDCILSGENAVLKASPSFFTGSPET